MSYKKSVSFGILVLATLLSFASGVHAQTWESITANVPRAITGDSARPMDTDGTRLYVRGTRGVYVSSDNGASFTTINDVAGTSVYTLTNLTHRFLKYENGFMWIGTDPGSAAINGSGPINLGHASLHRLTPGQTAWQKSSAGFPIADTGNQADDIAYDISTGTYYVAAALGGAFVSTDGSNWVQRTTGLGGIGVPSSVVAFNGIAFELRPLSQVCKTTNQGTNWVSLASHMGISSGYLLEKNGRIMFASSGNNTLQDGFNYSDDSGVTWTFLTGLRGTADLTLKDNLIYAAGGFGGINEQVWGRYAFKFSATDGITWDNLPTNGLPVDSFSGFNANRVVRQGNYLFMHSFTNLYRLDVSGFDFRPTTQIVRQPPATMNLIVGQVTNLNLIAGGANLAYQWRLNGTNIAGATNTTFPFASAQLTNSGNYTVLLTGDRGSVTSSVSTVTVAVRIEGKYDITYNNPTTGGSLYLLPDASLVSVGGAIFYKMGPDGARTVTRNISGALFPVNLLDSSNRVMLAGTTTLGTQIKRVLSTDLTDDPSFNGLLRANSSSTISAMAELPGRGYLVSGIFTSFRSVSGSVITTNAVTNICLITYAGTVDTNFSVGGVGPNDSPSRIVVESQTNIYIGGNFSTWNAVAANSFQKLNANGSLDLNFSHTATGNNVSYFKAYAPGKLFVVISSKPGLMNPDGSLDGSFNPSNSVFNGTVQSMAVGESNKLYVVGGFTTYGSTTVGKYIRLYANGTADTNFNSTVGPVSGGFAWDLYDPRGYLYVVRDDFNNSFLGQSYGTGPYRLWAGTNAGSATGFAAWQAQYTFPGGLSAANQDADGDGILNIFEYYFGSNPTNAASGAQPTEVTVNVSGTNYPAITFIRSQNVSGVTLLPQVSSSVNFSDSLGFTVTSIVDLGNGTEQVTIRSNVSMGAQVAQFLRIQLTAP